ncbi:MAG: Tol-Pal system beta propeller repeat protein TolB [Nitrospirae bacterium]|nr:Tol-Pal system beta propeller repeat protein TolB [Nitrospirota bacterium]
MIEKSKVKSQKSKVFIIFFCFSLFTFHFSLFTSLEAKVYIDINSPAFKKLPIAIQEFSGISGKEISDIIHGDLEFTGLFAHIDRAAYIENPSQPFNPRNWTPIGVEAVVKGSIKDGKDFTVTVSLYDVFEGKEILKKEYKTEKELIRPLSHAIANDIYKALTGETGIFRSRIAFVAEDEGGKGIYIMDWDGNRITKMGLKGNLVLSPRWSRDGTKLIYSAERNRQWGIYLLDFINMTERKVFSSKGTNMVGDFLPEGNDFILSSSKDGTPDLYIMNLKNNKIIKLTSSYGIEVSPTVSPDGKYIAFVSDRGGSPQIYVMRRDGSDVRRITFEGSYNTSPSWSLNGDRIIFAGRRGTNQIFTVKPDGTGLTQLTTHGNNEDPSFSPDGRYITFSSDRDGVKGIYIMRVNGESQKRITPKNLRAFGPRWSPN